MSKADAAVLPDGDGAMSASGVPVNSRLLTIGEVAGMLRVGDKWVRNHQDELRAIKLGKYIRSRREDIEAYADERGPTEKAWAALLDALRTLTEAGVVQWKADGRTIRASIALEFDGAEAARASDWPMGEYAPQFRVWNAGENSSEAGDAQSWDIVGPEVDELYRLVRSKVPREAGSCDRRRRFAGDQRSS